MQLPAIKILLAKALIEVQRKQVGAKNFKYYKLSQKGHEEFIEKRLEANHLKEKYFDIRSKVIDKKYKTKYDIGVLGRKHFLEDFNIEVS